MIEVNISNLEEIISNYNEIIKKIEENNSNIIQNFNDLSKNWKDEKNQRLTSNFNLEKHRIIKLEDNVKEQLSVYKYIEAGYKELGNKIKCNLNSRDLINSKLDDIINTLNVILSQYNSLGDISFYPKANIIYNQKKEIRTVLTSFNNIKENINSKFDKVEEIEKTVAEYVSKFNIETFILNNYEGEE